MSQTKICKTHGELKPEQIVIVKKLDRTYSTCIQCRATSRLKYSAANREKILKAADDYNKNNPIKRRLAERKYRTSNKGRKTINGRNHLYDKKQINELSDRYVKRILIKETILHNSERLKFKDIPDYLVILKRATILLRRFIKGELNEY